MTDEALEKFKKIKDEVVNTFPEKELWPTYFERRYLEFLTLHEFMPEKKFFKVLELGCGMGYYSAFLSQIAEEVVATDLEVIDPQTHSVGLQATREFLSELKIRNVTIQHASAEDLPFEANSFDMVFSSHVLEHVPNTQKAVSEINRVLKPHGINFCVVPTTTDRIYSLPAFYVNLIKRTIVKLLKKVVVTRNSGETKQNVSSLKASSGYYLKHFPFPPPHGVHPSYIQELKNWTLQSWVKVLSLNGKINLLTQRGLQMNPLFALIGGIFPFFGLKIYSLTRKIENRVSKNTILKYFGISTLIITEKT